VAAPEVILPVCQDSEARMFETLEERIEQTEGSHLSTKQRVLRYAGLLGLTIVIFGGLFMAVRMLG
jgi:hypothetical protein